MNRLAGEIARVLESTDKDAMLKRLLENYTVEVKAQFRLVPDEAEKTNHTRKGSQASGGKHR